MEQLQTLAKAHTRIRRPENLPPWQPMAAHLRLLQLLYTYRYMTSSMLELAYERTYDGGRSNVANMLTQLSRHGYIERFFRPLEAGSNQYVITVSVKGAHLLITDSEWPGLKRQIYNLVAGKATYGHQLAVSTLRLLWTLGTPSPDKVFRDIVYWSDREGTKRETINAFNSKVNGERYKVKPDTTTLIGHYEGNFYRPYFFEIERSHRSYDRMRQRIHGYTWLLTRPEGRDEVNRVIAKHIDPRITAERGFVVFIAADQAHAERLRQTMVGVLEQTDLSRKQWPHALFTSLDRFYVAEPQRYRSGPKAGQPKLGRTGKPVMRNQVIEPAHFFQHEIFVNLKGRPGRIVE